VKTVYLGTSDFAAEVLRRLAASEHRPALVVAPPDRPRGRGRRTLPPPAVAAAAELGIERLQTANLNEGDAMERIRAAGADLGVVCAFGQIIREPLLSELPLINVHPSLLPRWRGAAPIERAIMAGDPRTGVSVMKVTEGLDSGPVALCEGEPIAEADDFGSLSSRLAALGGELIVRALDRRAQDELNFTDQDDAAATYADKIEPSERRLDPARPAAELARRVRALTPHIGTHLELAGGARLGVRGARPLEDGPGQGELRAEGDALLLGCAEGALRLEIVQPEGGRPMDAAAYLRGHPAPAL
jgi:methionyl-tRNA formyltransferase